MITLSISTLTCVFLLVIELLVQGYFMLCYTLTCVFLLVIELSVKYTLCYVTLYVNKLFVMSLSEMTL